MKPQTNNSTVAWVFLNGDLGDVDFLPKMIKSTDFIVACDGGLNTIKKLKLKQNAVVGDFDSATGLPKKVIELTADKSGAEVEVDNITYKKYWADKDFLDCELAIDFAVKLGYSKINIVNVLGSEIDHLIGTIFMLSKPKYKNLDLRIITSNQEITYRTGKIKINGQIGQKVSLIPINGEVKVASSTGLKYDPSDYKMKINVNAGISNRLTSTTAEVDVTSGSFLIVKHI